MSIQPIATLPGHTDRAWQVAWSPSTPLLASCSSDKSIRFYTYTPPPPSTASSSSSSTSFPRFTFSSSIPSAHPRTIRSVSFSPTGQTLTTASFDSTVGVWSPSTDRDDNEQASTEWETAGDSLEGHESECKSAQWSSDGRLLASCSRDKSVWVWEAVSPTEFECLAVLMEHEQDVKSLAWHPQDELLASASYDDTIKLYAADPYDDEWSCVYTLVGHTSTVWAITFSPCGTYLASAGDDRTLKIWQRTPKASAVEVGQLGEAKREEGGRMGPWSAGGVRIGIKERWEWKLVASWDDGLHSRTIYSLDWNRSGVEETQGGLGRIVTGGGDGVINVLQMMKPSTPEGAPSYKLISSVESSHGVSDVNHVAWCKLSPAKAAATLKKLEGGQDEEENEEDQEMETEDPSTEEDSRWKGVEDMFASAGDDGLVKVWSVRPTAA
ncbi:BZ3500_MvSof-1268-A1-R1_Chr9g10452 [Microbotryum saponariae]|uniref:Probable cytosolic iron-sulfur protein assembly protein 1 n=1 Tax=Microbotryum saponariae TaxID=289078 RepID=A0A2X0ME96_9BASI|nr:BZ3501_MvSof-1269-A2-R1_Chr9g10202 [Microbotryum saponariae]SDA00116.1 BZ3500_MvSof-1268-A1-R1_Chr9g10452 [Microbotryum saponariae]